MASDFTEYNTLNAVRIVELCLKAGQPQMITAALLDHRSADSIEAELAAATTRAPDRTAARAPTSTQAALRDAIEKRFRAQNKRAT